MADKDRIRSEIEEKRLRVAKLRERRKELTGKPTLTSTSPTEQATTSKPASETKPTKSTTTSEVDALLASIPGLLPSPRLPPPNSTSVSPTTSTPTPPQQQQQQQQPIKPKLLTVVKEEAIVDIIPHESLTYTRQTQTNESSMQEMIPPQTQDTPTMPITTAITTANPLIPTSQQQEQGPKQQEQQLTISEEEKKSIMQSNEFTHFLARSSRIVERVVALNEQFPDVTTDYLGENSLLQQQQQLLQSQQQNNKSALSNLCNLSGGVLTKGRTTTCLSWSPHNSELLLAGFSNRNISNSRQQQQQQQHFSTKSNSRPRSNYNRFSRRR